MLPTLRALDPATPGAPPLRTPEQARRWESFLASAARQSDPLTSLIIEGEGSVLGWARMDRLTERWYCLLDLVLLPELEREALGRSTLSALPLLFAGSRLEAATWARHSDPELQRIVSGPLEGGRFALYVEKLYVRRTLTEFQSPYQDPFALVSLSDAGEDAFVDALGEAMAASPARDLHPERPREEFLEMRALEAETHDPERWSIALMDGEPAGVILANRFPLDDEGTFTFIGVSRRFRGRGLGAVLHARGLEVLREMGVHRYLCSTDLHNTPMLRTYARHGCQPFDIRRQYLWTPDEPVILG